MRSFFVSVTILGALIARPALATTGKTCETISHVFPLETTACDAVATTRDEVRTLRAYFEIRDLVAETQDRDLHSALVRTMRGIEDIAVVRRYLEHRRSNR